MSGKDVAISQAKRVVLSRLFETEEAENSFTTTSMYFNGFG